MINEAHRRFLLDQTMASSMRHSASLRYPGRTLYLHLVGTHALLEAWGRPERVCHGGLFHSIYGTNKFRKWAWPISDRQPIQDLIGEPAERLAYIFALSNRPLVWCDGRSARFDLSDEDLRDLREIEAANLMEQGSNSRWLMRLMVRGVSEPCERAIAEYLNKRADDIGVSYPPKREAAA